MLKSNEHGGYVIRQSDLSAWSRCQTQEQYYRAAKADPSAPQGKALSATVYGTVVHYAMLNMEKLHHAGKDTALDVGIATFLHYWNPEHIHLVAEKVDTWLPRQTYGSLRDRGREALTSYYKLLLKEDAKLLALEYQFSVPLTVNGRRHTLTGTIDRLTLKKWYGTPYISIDDFKGLPLDTKLPTPSGWTTMGEVRPGDRVMGANGKPCRVVNKSSVHHNLCYEMVFSDGQSIVADHEHQWQVETDGGSKVLTTVEIRQNLINPATGQRHMRVLNAEALQLPKKNLPIHPYVFGAWLGDGRRARGSISKPDQELFDRIEACGHRVGPNINSPGRCPERTIYGLSNELRKMGALGTRDVPQVYLRGSLEQRLNLLRGLMDTDGSWNKGRRQAVFTTCERPLANVVFELVASLGWRPALFPVTRSGFGKTVEAFDVSFTPVSWNPFSLTRKAELVDTLDATRPNIRSGRRMVMSVEPVATVPTQCIQVDSEDSLYLFGSGMIPTHNTGKQPTYLRYHIQGTAYSYATLRPEFWITDEHPSFDEQTVANIEHSFAKLGFRLHAGTKKEWWTELMRKDIEMVAARRFRWINLQTVKYADGGWRGEIDYQRLETIVDAYVRAHEAEIFQLNLIGEVCVHCPFNHICAGTGVADDEHGRPAKRYSTREKELV